jgi:hypothetical protein
MTRHLRLFSCSAVTATVGAVALMWLASGAAIAANVPVGTCSTGAQATAQAYASTGGGASNGEILVSGYTAADCVGLGQTHAIFQAGNACENAGLPSGFGSGTGFAVVDWFLSWWGDDEFLSFGTEQQYDCADTFS